MLISQTTLCNWYTITGQTCSGVSGPTDAWQLHQGGDDALNSLPLPFHPPNVATTIFQPFQLLFPLLSQYTQGRFRLITKDWLCKMFFNVPVRSNSAVLSHQVKILARTLLSLKKKRKQHNTAPTSPNLHSSLLIRLSAELGG